MLISGTKKWQPPILKVENYKVAMENVTQECDLTVIIYHRKLNFIAKNAWRNAQYIWFIWFI